MLLMKAPVPVPSDVLLLLIVGLADVDQQTPLAVIETPPSDVIFPPETAVVDVREVIAVVDKAGTAKGFVLKEISFPYAVPAVFVEYART